MSLDLKKGKEMTLAICGQGEVDEDLGYCVKFEKLPIDYKFQQSVDGPDEKMKNEQKFTLIDENGSENQISSYISTKLLSLVNTKRFHVCLTCSTIFCKPKSYVEHLKQCKRVINQSTSTDFAGVKISTPLQFSRQPQFRCLKCKTLFTSEEVLLTHYKACQIYNCAECNKQFSSEGTLKIHLLTKHCEDNQSLQSKHEFTCESCSKEYLDSLENIYAYFPKFNKIMCNYCKWSCSPSLLIENSHVEIISSDSDTSVAKSISEPIHTDNIHLSADVPRQEKPRRISKMVKGIDLSQIHNNATPTSNALLQHESKIDGLFEVISLIELKTSKCCRVCKNEYKNIIALKKHYRYCYSLHSLLNNPQTFFCTFCPSKQVSFKQIRDHLYENHVPFLKCEYCDFIFCSVKDRTRHREESHSEICQFCTVTITRSKEEIKEHLTWHLTEESVKCDTCDEMFTGVRKLRVHKKKKKQKPKKTKGLCVNCGKVSNDLKRHLRTAHRKKLCLTCGKLLSESVYRYHTNVLHKNFENAAVQCPACGKMQKSYKHLNLHRRIVHEKHLYIQCPTCPRKFPFPSHLKKHLALCTAQIFECDACGKLVRSKNILMKHLGKKHGMVVRGFACRYCPNMFARKDVRMIHERIHTGERPYCCSVCGQRFRQLTDLKRHEGRHSGKMPFARLKKGKKKTSTVCDRGEVGEDLEYYVEYENLPNDSKFQQSVGGPDEKKKNEQKFTLIDENGSENQISSYISTKLLSLVNAKRFYLCFTCCTIFCKPKTYAEHLKQCKQVIDQSTDSADVKISSLFECEKPQFRCLKCNTLFASEDVLLSHYKMCLVYNCVECNKQFSSEGTLKIHFLTKHCKDNQSLQRKHEFTCESCCKEFLDSLESIYAYFPKFKKIMCNYCKWSYSPWNNTVTSLPSSSAPEGSLPKSLLMENSQMEIISSDSDTSVARSIPEPIRTDKLHFSVNIPRQLNSRRISKTVNSIDLLQIQKNSTPTSNALLQYESKIDGLFEVISLKEFNSANCCRICEFKSKTFITIKRHYIKDHSLCSLFQIPQAHFCTCCRFKCAGFKQMGHHLYENHVPFLKCEYCDLTFCSVKGRTRHREESHSEICQFCTVTVMRSKEDIKEHLTWHLTEESVKCETCDEMFTGIRKLRVHKKKIKQKPKKTRGLCVNCGKVSNDLKRHLRTAHHKKLCLTCGKLLSEGVYRYHTNVLHKNFENTAVQCPACGKMQKSYKQLNLHRRMIHEKHLYIPCPNCPKKFPFPYQLKYHSATCRGKNAKIVECDACGKGFKSKIILLKHLRNDHGMVVRRFACRHCPDMFIRNDARICHERIHTGERPYCCSVCGQRFRQLTDLKRHEGRHSGKMPFARPKKGKKKTSAVCGQDEVGEDLEYYVEYEKFPISKRESSFLDD